MKKIVNARAESCTRGNIYPLTEGGDARFATSATLAPTQELSIETHCVSYF
jgi:hypothetical protein